MILWDHAKTVILTGLSVCCLFACLLVCLSCEKTAVFKTAIKSGFFVHTDSAARNGGRYFKYSFYLMERWRVILRFLVWAVQGGKVNV